ncbi:M23 family metallopeptidase [Aliikangiella coralliicola]|uniref:M23 family metallopeptidase n=1 Tax=Aliikangiella coralliicola TaxID=2592383 RepID=A0A545UJA4_9GAMM|nr:M23 family metallopeptidase [Aliikangiella coralliicola]TQV89541.1 M23 family metallopeptidase [Aliikangiella coralliicola]
MMKPLISLKQKMLLSIAASIFTMTVSGAEYLYDLPFKGEDFADNEKLTTKKHDHGSESQSLGSDISAMRYDFDNRRWTKLIKDADVTNNIIINEHTVGYGKPIYAMRDGTVVGCWRNAPENPRSFINGEDEEARMWVHPRIRDIPNRTIPKSGNYLLVDHDDGTRVRYSHMIPGTIPWELCPRNTATYDELGLDSIPGNDHPTLTGISSNIPGFLMIKKGQRIGLLGNSGNSRGPHLHIHIVDGENAEPIKFKRGIASVIKDDDPYGNWKSFADDVIPTDMSQGSILLWAPRTLKSQHVRHGFNSAGYSAYFKHLVDSGFKPVWLDGFTAANTTRLNMIWKPSNVKWRSYSRLTSNDYQLKTDQAKEKGYIPVHVDSYNTAGGVRYAVIFEKKPLGALAGHDLTPAEHLDLIDEAKLKGMSPVSVSVVSVGGQRRYTVLYHKKDIGAWRIRSTMTSIAYNLTYASEKAAGKFPVYLNAYRHDGENNYTAIFASKPTSNSVRAKHGLTAADFQIFYNEYDGLDYSTSLITGIDGHPTTNYAGVWRK